MAANTTCESQSADPPLLKFPPFPKPVEGMTIIPFKDFKPRGIQLFAQTRISVDGKEEDDVELDGMGVPTVELRVKHRTDECKGDPRKKRKKKKTTVAPDAPVKKLPWYEEWEEGEHLRLTKNAYDLSSRPSDRLLQAAIDFRAGRPWPPVPLGLNEIWDQFRLYIGLLVNPTVHTKDRARAGEQPGSDSEDDDDVEPMMTDTVSSMPGEKKRPRSTMKNDDEGEDEICDEQKVHAETSEEKLTAFLDDPEKSVRVFLSSFMREHGLIWAERNLTSTPHLLSFFVRFILRNRVVPEPAYQRGLKRALGTIELAKKELPLTYKIGHILPDAFSQACKESFGRKGTVNWTRIAADLPEEEEPKLTVTDSLTGGQKDITLPSEKQIRLKEAIEDNLDMEVDATQLPPATSTWGVADDRNGCSTTWDGCDIDDTQATWGNIGDNQSIDTHSNDPFTWTGSAPTWGCEVPSLDTLLGAVPVQSTHTTGIVESSTRRIREVHQPVPQSEQSMRNQDDASRDWAASPLRVEVELDTRFAKVVLAPWGSDGGDISKPEIWQTSRGFVVDPNASDPPAVVLDDDARRPHNPLTDDITLLVEPRLLETLSLAPGLGLGAVWIQLVRREMVEEGVTQKSLNTEHECPKNLWYHEDVLAIFPSFYTPSEEDLP